MIYTLIILPGQNQLKTKLLGALPPENTVLNNLLTYTIHDYDLIHVTKTLKYVIVKSIKQ